MLLFKIEHKENKDIIYDVYNVIHYDNSERVLFLIYDDRFDMFDTVSSAFYRPYKGHLH